MLTAFLVFIPVVAMVAVAGILKLVDAAAEINHLSRRDPGDEFGAPASFPALSEQPRPERAHPASHMAHKYVLRFK